MTNTSIPVKEGNHYYCINESGEKNGPFCLRCYDVNEILVHLVINSNPLFFPVCPECKTPYPR